MNIRHAIVAVTAAATLAAITTTSTAQAEPRGFRPPSDSLRSYASPINLRIGVAVNPEVLADKELADIAADEFSSLTAENEMKWETVEPERGTYDWSGADEVVDFARAHGQKVRGHTLLWHNQNPAWLTEGVEDGSIDDRELREILKKHITDEVRHFRGRIYQWDVANEFFTDTNPSRLNPDNFWVSHLGPGVIADAFRWAHAADPKARLFYNDYNIAGEDGHNAKADAVHAFVKSLKKQGVPIHGVGNQGHLDTQYGFSGERFRADLQRYADLGLEVAVTEADVRTFVDSPETQVPTDDLALFAHSYEFSQMLQACLDVRACTSFTVWGIDDPHSWVPGWFEGQGYALLWDVNRQPKDAYTALKQDLRLALGAPRRR
ncbi:endo-1,4-beta-xylanase [Nocardioides luteus]|uniref:Beta-xylanase n=1 Tax=Nocardioides luteus TaxID=1844 RepID=A0ABQ5SYR8_9ACTN|nr:endo-1,4-beta-xylanase [Nocardioides luteus]MDR7311827.1 endo-1,4-beta-xylanase [Nocardioides luteus]GGR71614.1 beta-xylanase [Nocardioides luteus]GLJ68071.1 beta-xylanase [Nocardioides luteus]